jgi:hypothetical protein
MYKYIKIYVEKIFINFYPFILISNNNIVREFFQNNIILNYRHHKLISKLVNANL